jgi:ubiquinone biosynthesis protein COQ4
MPTWGFRLAPREWLRLLPLVRKDPYDVVLGARVFFSIGGHDEGPTWSRMMMTGTGRRLAAARAPYPPLFTDYERLRALPDGTLGREYVRELDERSIHPLELKRVTESAWQGRRVSPEHAWIRDRVRDAHDLYHTLTGYGIDVYGEGGNLAFTFAQTGNKGWLVLVLLNGLTALASGRFDGWRVYREGWRRGRRARFLAAVDDWDRLLRLPLEQARRELGITPPRPYRPLSLEEIFGIAPPTPDGQPV